MIVFIGGSALTGIFPLSAHIFIKHFSELLTEVDRNLFTSILNHKWEILITGAAISAAIAGIITAIMLNEIEQHRL